MADTPGPIHGADEPPPLLGPPPTSGEAADQAADELDAQLDHGEQAAPERPANWPTQATRMELPDKPAPETPQAGAEDDDEAIEEDAPTGRPLTQRDLRRMSGNIAGLIASNDEHSAAINSLNGNVARLRLEGLLPVIGLGVLAWQIMQLTGRLDELEAAAKLAAVE